MPVTYCMPVTRLDTLHMFSHLLLKQPSNMHVSISVLQMSIRMHRKLIILPNASQLTTVQNQHHFRPIVLGIINTCLITQSSRSFKFL